MENNQNIINNNDNNDNNDHQNILAHPQFLANIQRALAAELEQQNPLTVVIDEFLRQQLSPPALQLQPQPQPQAQPQAQPQPQPIPRSYVIELCENCSAGIPLYTQFMCVQTGQIVFFVNSGRRGARGGRPRGVEGGRGRGRTFGKLSRSNHGGANDNGFPK